MTDKERKAAERSLMTAKERKAADKAAYKAANAKPPADKAAAPAATTDKPHIVCWWRNGPFLAGYKGGKGVHGFAVAFGKLVEFCGKGTLDSRYKLQSSDVKPGTFKVGREAVDAALVGFDLYGKSAWDDNPRSGGAGGGGFPVMGS